MTAAILTLSDKGSKGKRMDESGPIIRNMLKGIGFEVKHYKILPDERNLIKNALIKYSKKVSLIITTGGTGLSPRDVTPEATKEVIDKEVPGISEAIRLYGVKKTKRAMLSRGVAGIRDKTLIINLPGSPKAVKEGMTAIIDVIPHAVEKLRGSCIECAR
ncbi:MAG: MogA/MoaB family molybdenum cofactor biosynthesis protein [Nitrospirae bacterium]|nr:MogA/MoaB family molybdenum cofactor biosynthesis protein [Nitrospirota bacterium]